MECPAVREERPGGRGSWKMTAFRMSFFNEKGEICVVYMLFIHKEAILGDIRAKDLALEG